MGGCQRRAVRRQGAVSGGRGSHAGSTPLTAPQDCSASRPKKRRHLCGRCCRAGAAAAGRARPRGRSLRRADLKQGPLARRTGTAETSRRTQECLPPLSGPILGVSKTLRWAHAADIWILCCSSFRLRSSEGLTHSTCLIAIIVASTGSGSAVPPRGNAEVPAGVWIAWVSPCRCPQTAMDTPPVPPTAVAKAGWGALGHWREHGDVILGHLLSDEKLRGPELHTSPSSPALLFLYPWGLALGKTVGVGW